MPKKLDRKRDFGTVWGSEDGTCYVQDEVHFDYKGDEILPLKPVEIPPVEIPSAASAPDAPAAPSTKKSGKNATAEQVTEQTTGLSNEDQLSAQTGGGDA